MTRTHLCSGAHCIDTLVMEGRWAAGACTLLFGQEADATAPLEEGADFPRAFFSQAHALPGWSSARFLMEDQPQGWVQVGGC